MVKLVGWPQVVYIDHGSHFDPNKVKQGTTESWWSNNSPYQALDRTVSQAGGIDQVCARLAGSSLPIQYRGSVFKHCN